MFRKILFLIGICMCVYSLFGEVIVKREDPRGAWGRLEIPRIQVSLPIYPEATEELLQHGVVQVEHTHLPGQGKNKHSLLAGHRGLPGKNLLSYLDQVREGDRFYIWHDNEQLVYEVCKIRTMKPEDAKYISVEEGRELVSLITCTPQGIYTHRLVVTGERIK